MTSVRRRVVEVGSANPVTPIHVWRSPSESTVDLVIVTHMAAYRAIHEHAERSLPNETGGFLLGRVGCDPQQQCWHLEIDEALPVEPSEQDPVHFTFSWKDVDRVRSYRETRSNALLGWYHTHPNLGIFLSDTDLERTHRILFGELFQVALVYDPVRCRAGYFFWDGPQRIDPSEAGWREFAISVLSPAPAEPATPALSEGGCREP